MHQYRERDRDEDRKSGGKTLVKEIYTCAESVGLNVEDVLNRTKWKRSIKIVPVIPDDGK